MADGQNQDDQFVVLDCVDNPIHTDPVAIEVVLALELFRLAVAGCNC
jgi:hypothetical protein